MKTRTNHKRNSAFTLMELLIVVAIIGVLAMLLLPALGKAREKGWRVQCVSNQKQWAIAFEMYSNENGGVLFHTVGSFDWDDVTGTVGSETVTNVYLQYMGGGKATERIRTMRTCPAVAAKMSKDALDNSQWHTYAMAWPSTLKGGIYQNMSSTAGLFINLRVLTKPAEYLLLIDSIDSKIKCGALVGDCSKPGPGGKSAITRHGGGVNALFADYHVEYLTQTQLKKQDAVTCNTGNPWFAME